MENVKIESRYLKLCSECRAVIRCMKAAFYRPDYQKLLMCPLIRRLGREFISKHAAEPLKRSAKLLKHSAELLEHSVELSRVQEKTKSLAESLESSAECLKSSSVCFIIIGPMLSQSTTVATTGLLSSSFVTANLHSIQKTFTLTHPSKDKSKFTVRPSYTLAIRRFCKRSSVIEMSIMKAIKYWF